MSFLPVTEPDGLLSAERRHQTWLRSISLWLAQSRSHRIVCIVVALLLLNVFDLLFTLLAYEQGMLEEQNPLARLLLPHGILSLSLFKIGMVLIGIYPLLKFRNHRIVEMSAFIGLLIYITVAFHWNDCYHLYMLTGTEGMHVPGALVDIDTGAFP